MSDATVILKDGGRIELTRKAGDKLGRYFSGVSDDGHEVTLSRYRQGDWITTRCLFVRPRLSSGDGEDWTDRCERVEFADGGIYTFPKRGKKT